MTTKTIEPRLREVLFQKSLGKQATETITTTAEVRELFETPEYADIANQLPSGSIFALLELAPSLPPSEIENIRSSFSTPLLYSQHLYIEALYRRAIEGYSRGIGSVGHLGKAGYTKSYVREFNSKGVAVFVTFPEVMIHTDDSSYVTRIKKADVRNVEKELLVSLAYCYRYGIPTKNVTAEAAAKVQLKESKILKIQNKAKEWSLTVKTIDEELIVWAEKALEKCNSVNQTQVVVEIYSEACRFANTQPVISKKRIAERAGVDRKVVRRLIERLEAKDLLQQEPENFDHTKGKSDARIINLGTQPNRWSGKKHNTPNRSQEHLTKRREHKQKLEKLNSKRLKWRGNQ